MLHKLALTLLVIFGVVLPVQLLASSAAPIAADAERTPAARPVYVPDSPLTATEPLAEGGDPLPALSGRAPERPGSASLDRQALEALHHALAARPTRIHRKGCFSPAVEQPVRVPIPLDAAARARLERILHALEDRLAELGRTPNDVGWTYAELADGSAAGLDRFLGSAVPGRIETYAEAARRLSARALDEIADVLPTDRVAAWRALAEKTLAATAPFGLPEALLRGTRTVTVTSSFAIGTIRMRVPLEGPEAASIRDLKLLRASEPSPRHPREKGAMRPQDSIPARPAQGVLAWGVVTPSLG